MTFSFKDPLHKKLTKDLEILGVPVVVVLENPTGFVVTHKGRKDIFDMGVPCIKNWTNDMPNRKSKKDYLDKGATIVAERIKAEEEEAKRKAKEEKDNE